LATRGKIATDMTGQRFGKVVVRERSSLRGAHAYWLVRCDCGTEKVVSGSELRRGLRTSCGCGIRTHGLSRSSTYKSWQAMWTRCTNTSNDNYPRYGGRGITVCERWERFSNFVADMGLRPTASSLDRIDPRGNYDPANCRWASRSIQDANTRRSFGYTTLDGMPISIRQMARFLAMSENAFYGRWTRMRLAR
jgi:hypothetical protein